MMKKKNSWIHIIIECMVMVILSVVMILLAHRQYPPTGMIDSGNAMEPSSDTPRPLENGEYEELSSEQSPTLLPYPEVMSSVKELDLEKGLNDTPEQGLADEKVPDPGKEEDEDVPDELLDPENYDDAPMDNGSPYYIKVNRSQNVVTIYALGEDGRYTVPVRALVCSVGRNNGTPTGTFRTSDKHEWSVLVGGVYGQYAYRIDGHIMFHSVPYFTRNEGDLESEEYNKLGTAASLGCVRMAVADAKWIYDHCPSGTIVTIYDSDYPGPLGKPVAEKIDLEDERAGWDPTDQKEGNPWNTGNIRFFGCGERILERGYSYDLLAGVTAFDEDGNELTDQIKVDTDCNPWKTGEYSVTYYITTPEGKTASIDSKVVVQDHQKPEILVAQEYLTLNRIQASAHNWQQALRDQVQAEDTGMRLSESHIQIQMEEPNKDVSQMEAVILATDPSGNESRREMPVYIDWNPPVIEDPKGYEIPGGSEDEIREQLAELIEVTDAESGIGELRITWTKHISYDTYNIMIIAKDHYGNVSTRFFEEFHITTLN